MGQELSTKLVCLGLAKGWHQCFRKMETHGKSMKIHCFRNWFFPFKSLYVKVAENAFFGFIRTHPTSDSRMSRKHTKNWWTHWKTMRNMKNSLNSMKIQRRTQQEHETRTACHIFRILLTIKCKHDPEKLQAYPNILSPAAQNCPLDGMSINWSTSSRCTIDSTWIRHCSSTIPRKKKSCSLQNRSNIDCKDGLYNPQESPVNVYKRGSLQKRNVLGISINAPKPKVFCRDFLGNLRGRVFGKNPGDMTLVEV